MAVTKMPAARWRKADDNFREQIRRLMVVMGTEDKRVVAREANLSEYKMYTYFNTPSKMPKRAERMIASVFEQYGMTYDPTLGEGAAS